MKGVRVLFLSAGLMFAITPDFCYSGASLNMQVFDTGYSQVWKELVNMITADGMAISKRNEGSGTIVTKYKSINVEELATNVEMPDRGISGGFQRPWLWGRYRAQFTLKKLLESKTEIKMTVRYEGWNVSAGRYVTLVSNGSMEHKFLDAIGGKFGNKL